MTMAPSTIIPMAMASPPRVIRFAVIPSKLNPSAAKSIENGIEKAATRLGRTPPMKSASTMITRTMPWISASLTVFMLA